MLGLRGGVCVCQVLSLKKSVTFSCVERGLVFERGIGGIGIGIDANVSDRTNEADGLGECVCGGGGFRPINHNKKWITEYSDITF